MGLFDQGIEQKQLKKERGEEEEESEIQNPHYHLNTIATLEIMNSDTIIRASGFNDEDARKNFNLAFENYCKLKKIKNEVSGVG